LNFTRYCSYAVEVRQKPLSQIYRQFPWKSASETFLKIGRYLQTDVMIKSQVSWFLRHSIFDTPVYNVSMYLTPV